MTPQEAHEYMENEIRCIQRSKICDRDCAKCKLVKEDKPLIEAYGFAISALEKQIPKKPLHWDDCEQFYIECPCCGKRYGSRLGYKGCPYCLQAIRLE